MQPSSRLSVAIALTLSLTGCNAPIPDELTVAPPEIEVASIPVEYTEPIEPTLAVEITPDKLYLSTYFLHDTWREHLIKTFEDERSEKNWFAARQKLDEIYEELDRGVPSRWREGFIALDTSTWRKGRIEVVDLQDGEVPAKHILGDIEHYISPLHDELLEQIDILDHVAIKTGLKNWWIDEYPQHCLSHFGCGPHRDTLLLVVHPDVPARTVRQVIYTASLAELDRFQLLVNADQPRMVPIAETSSVGPPSAEEELTDACAMAHLSRADDSLFLVLDRVLRTYDEALPNSVPGSSHMELLHTGPRYPDISALASDDPWRARPAWDDALAVRSSGDCHSGEFGSVAQAKQRLERLLGKFDAAPICNQVFFDLPAPGGAPTEGAEALAFSDALEAIAAAKAALSTDRVFVDLYSDRPTALAVGADCSRTYTVGSP